MDEQWQKLCNSPTKGRRTMIERFPRLTRKAPWQIEHGPTRDSHRSEPYRTRDEGRAALRELHAELKVIRAREVLRAMDDLSTA